MVPIHAPEPSSPGCINGYRTRVSTCRCRKHWSGPLCDFMECGQGRLSYDQTTCLCPTGYVGRHCHFKICRLHRYNITYCYPTDNGATPLYSRCTVENRSFSTEGVGGELNIWRLENCPCFRGTSFNGKCRCGDDFWGNLCELRPGNAPEHLYFDSNGEMWKNTSLPPSGYSPKALSAAPWASPFTLFTIFILLAVLLIACFRQRHARWRVDSMRLQAMQVTLFRRAVTGDSSAVSQHRRNSRRFRLMFDGAQQTYRTEVNCQLEPMLTTIPSGPVPRELLTAHTDMPPPYEEVVSSPPPYKQIAS